MKRPPKRPKCPRASGRSVNRSADAFVALSVPLLERRMRSGGDQVGHRRARVLAGDEGLADEDDVGARRGRTRGRRAARGRRTRRPGRHRPGSSGRAWRTSTRSTSSVLRLRALTPIRSAPASTARGDLVLVVDLDQRGQPDRAGALDQSLELVVDQGRRRSGGRGRRRRRGPPTAGRTVTMKSLRSTGTLTPRARPRGRRGCRRSGAPRSAR